MATTRELYEDWKPLIEWEEQRSEVDVCQEAEKQMVIQVANGVPGESAGGPRDPGYSEPLMKKPPRRGLTNEPVGP